VIEDGTNAPIAGARVLAVQDRGPAPLTAGDRPFEAVSGVDGGFTFERMPPGRYVVTAQKSGYAAFPRRAVPSSPLEVRAGEHATAHDLVLSQAGVIAGRVIDESGRPVTEAMIVPMRRQPGRAPALQLMPSGGGERTNDRGEFRLDSLAAGEYYLRALPSPRGTFAGSPRTSARTVLMPTYFPSTTEPDAAQPIWVTAGQTSGDVAIRMLAGPAFQITGVVVDDGGSPVGGAMVVVTPDRSGSGPYAGPFPSQPRTDADGRFAVDGITAGEYILSAAAPRVMSRVANAGGTTGGIVGGFSSWSSGGRGVAGAGAGTSVTEMRDGITVQYRTDPATAQHITVNDADVAGVQLVAHRPPQ
jgi:protocatechuate 3,4-dioxygenase beta subunit